MNLLDIFGRRGQAGANRPDRLVGHHQIVGPRVIRQRDVELPAADVEGMTGIALALGFADADDRGEADAPDRLRLLPNPAEMSPVWAPDALGWQSCAPTATVFEPPALSAKAAISVAGGQTSRSALSATSEAPASMASNSPREALRPFIFQLPAINGRMISVMAGFS